MAEQRTYPVDCRSMYCGETDINGASCLNCANRPWLDDFNAWRERTKATQLDPVWSPTVWTATVPDPMNKH